MRIIFTATDKGLGQVGSRLIRAFEGGLASHCGAVLSTGEVVDASWPKGVKAHDERQFLEGRVVVADMTVTLPDEDAAQSWLARGVAEGWKYDVRGVASFLLWRDIGSRSRYECSALILRAMLVGGLDVHERHDRFGVRHLLILSDGLSR